MTPADLREFEVVVRTLYPGLKIGYKDQNSFQKVLGYLLFPFNPQFMTRYTTTFAPAVYFPSKDYYEGNPKSSMTLLAHEWVHLLDTERQPLWFRFSYMFPQIFAPAAFAAYLGLARSHSWPLAVLLGGVLLSFLIARVSMAAFFVSIVAVLAGSGFLAVHYSGWASLALAVGLVLLAPWPSFGRTHWEQRGYAMTLAIYRWTFGSVPQILRDSVAKSFTGSNYFFMSWSKKSIDAWVNATVDQASTGELAKEAPYGAVYEFLRSKNMVQ